MIHVSKTTLLIAAGLILTVPAFPANLNPVQWTLTAEPAIAAPGKETVLKLHAQIAPDYHLYSLTTPKGGPIQTTAVLAKTSGIVNTAVYQPPPVKQKDPTLGVTVEIFTGSVDFLLPATIAVSESESTKTIAVRVRYQACSDKICLPPVEREATTVLAVKTGVPGKSFRIPLGYRKVSLSHTAQRASVK